MTKNKRAEKGAELVAGFYPALEKSQTPSRAAPSKALNCACGHDLNCKYSHGKGQLEDCKCTFAHKLQLLNMVHKPIPSIPLAEVRQAIDEEMKICHAAELKGTPQQAIAVAELMVLKHKLGL